MQLLGATVSKAPRQVKTKYGDRLVCDVRLEDGSESAIWSPVNYAPVEYLTQGQAVTCSRDSKGKVSIVENHLTHPGMSAPSVPTVTTAPTQTQPQGMTPETKKAIASHIEEMASLFNYCYQTAAQKVQGLPPEQTREVATTLFIQASRKFNLA